MGNKLTVIRQNPRGCTNQRQMRDFILTQLKLTCPSGHIGEERNNVLDGVYNEHHEWSSRSQDRKFVEDLQIGQLVLVPFAGIKECMLVRIVSEPIFCVDTGLFIVERNGKIYIETTGDVPFRPVGRRIEIVDANIVLANKRILPRTTMSQINWRRHIPNI
jgi:hypothetical protein